MRSTYAGAEGGPWRAGGEVSGLSLLGDDLLGHCGHLIAPGAAYVAGDGRDFVWKGSRFVP